ncbi:hypothetical protein [Paenarthrobacter sp. JL.01a]|uniref:hypothetical protein n=1 Tax=Paenarthrobacter sp. JL.01a TaxID=2979324 RepID=UPI0021C63929|nr:hypothetical protein [Paenarthrobacter sp. JL.01a]UXM93032.1 hypothetical protein N5P29_06875 [Paenarthrobacter sp. JL.01a]
MNGLLLLNALDFLFGATMYVGTMWVLKFFLYPTWRSLARDNVDMHFGIPTRAATRFFTIVVPIMFISGGILVWSEWGTVRVIFAIICLVGIITLTVVGQGLIIPINVRIRGGDFADDTELRSLLQRWMLLNDIRFYVSTLTWASMVWLLVDRGRLLESFT